MAEPAVLLVEDDPSVRESVGLLLEGAGFGVVAVGDGRAALEAAAARPFDAVVLDVMLPGADGFTVCRQLRRSSSVPIVMLTARADTADVVRGLEAGADDYVTKPFEPAELVARARAAVRRSAPDVADVTTVRDLVVDRRAARVWRGGEEVALTAVELRLLAELARHAGRALSRQELLRLVWGYDYLGDSRLVDMAVQRLRTKLGPPPGGEPYVATLRGVGYRLEADGAGGPGDAGGTGGPGDP